MIFSYIIVNMNIKIYVNRNMDWTKSLLMLH
jgi:hypothetical protein